MKVFVVGVIQVLTWTVSKNVYPFFRVYGLTSSCKGLFSSPKKKDKTKKSLSRKKNTLLLSTPLREKASQKVHVIKVVVLCAVSFGA